MPIVNLTRKSWLATNVRTADSFFTRLVGLLRRKHLGVEEALWLVPSRGVHTIGMKFPIDVLYLDRENQVVAALENLAPNRLAPYRWRARSIIELPAGVIRKSRTVVGDHLEISLTSSSDLDDLKESLLSRASTEARLANHAASTDRGKTDQAETVTFRFRRPGAGNFSSFR